MLRQNRSRQKLIVCEAEPVWFPGFQRELSGQAVEVRSTNSLETISDKVHPGDQVVLWVVLAARAGEQVRRLTELVCLHPGIAPVLLTTATTSPLKWVLYELHAHVVLDQHVSTAAALKICHRYWKSGAGSPVLPWHPGFVSTGLS